MSLTQIVSERAVSRHSATAGLVVAVALAFGAAVLGYELAHDLVVAGLLTGALLGTITLAVVGLERFTAIIVCALPWLVLLINRTPTLTLTFMSAAATLLLLILAPPSWKLGLFPWFAIGAFGLVIVANAVVGTGGSQLQEAAKYSLFPAMALVVANPKGRRALIDMRKPLLASGVAAMAVQAISILGNYGQSSTYYGTGEQLGLVAESPHELALIGVMVAVACLISIRDLRLRILGAGIAATPALATGVRSALVALAVALILLAVYTRLRPSMIIGIAAVLAAIIVTGVGTIIVTRYEVDRSNGQFTSFSTAGSGRGGLWESAVNQWAGSSPSRASVGFGFRSIQDIEQRAQGEVATAQSDPVSILVELGVLGLVAWLLVWLALVRSGINWLVLVPLAVYMVVNGSMEYVGAIVYGIALAGALTPWRHSRHPGHAPG